jgi:hypothetical protein
MAELENRVLRAGVPIRRFELLISKFCRVRSLSRATRMGLPRSLVRRRKRESLTFGVGVCSRSECIRRDKASWQCARS